MSKTLLYFWKMDKNKCPIFKIAKNFWKKYFVFWKGSSKNDFLKVVSNTVRTSELKIYHFVIIVKYFFVGTFWNFWNFFVAKCCHLCLDVIKYYKYFHIITLYSIPIWCKFPPRTFWNFFRCQMLPNVAKCCHFILDAVKCW